MYNIQNITKDKIIALANFYYSTQVSLVGNYLYGIIFVRRRTNLEIEKSVFLCFTNPW